MRGGGGGDGRLERAYAFYHAYHRDGRNQLVHVVFVPMILVGALMLCEYVGAALRWAVVAAYALYYLKLDVPIGLAAVPYMLLLGQLSGRLFDLAGAAHAWKAALAANALSWTAQILSHHYMEGGRPALLDNLVQSFAMAPLFVYLEALAAAGVFRRRVRQLQMLRA